MKTRYFTMYGRPYKTARDGEAFASSGNCQEIDKAEYEKLRLEINKRISHRVQVSLDWDTFQDLTKHAKTSKLKPADLAAGIIKIYYKQTRRAG